MEAERSACHKEGMVHRSDPHFQALYAKLSEALELAQQMLEQAEKLRDDRPADTDPAELQADIDQLKAAEEAVRHGLAYLVSSDD